ncbi:MAG: hypothetical protein O2782_12665 [bacterium]|nr:hypothetical protein [bacterium]
MKRVLLTGRNGTVADAMQKQLADTYEISGMSIPRMDDVISATGATTWKDLRDAYRNRVMEQLEAAFKGKDAVVHLG